MSLTRLVPFGLILLFATPAAADRYPRQPGVDVVNYTFRLTLSDATDVIVGNSTVEFELREAARTLALDLASAAGPGAGGMQVQAVTAGGAPLQFTHAKNRLIITLPASMKTGSRERLAIAYRGVPAAGLVIAKNKYGDRTFFSNNWPDKAREWLPVIDHPYDKATCDFIVTAPSHYQVISNGLEIEETDIAGNQRTTHYRQSVPIAPWLYVLGVARFAVQHVGTHAGAPIETWVYPQDRDAGFFDFAVPTPSVMAFLSERVGPYPYEKLANVQSNTVRGGMESATSIFYGDDAVSGQRAVRWRNVIIHEVAHQWFGDSVTERDWDDVWLSEGFATYFAALYVEHTYGREEFVATLVKSRDKIRAFDRKYPDYRVVHDNLADMNQVISPQTYDKGSWTLHMLRGVIGDGPFWAGIRAYYAQYRNGSATTADFRRAMEQASGRELTWFFDEWLYKSGELKVDGGWRYDAAAKALVIDLTQTQTDGSVFRMPVDVDIVGADGLRRRERIEMTGTKTRVSLPLDTPPADVVLDPGMWVLMESTFARRAL